MKRVAACLMLLSSISFIGCAQKEKTSDAQKASEKKTAPAQEVAPTQEVAPAQEPTPAEDADFSEEDGDFAEEEEFTDEGDSAEEIAPAEKPSSSVQRVEPPGEVSDELFEPDGEGNDDEGADSEEQAEPAQDAYSSGEATF